MDSASRINKHGTPGMKFRFLEVLAGMAAYPGLTPLEVALIYEETRDETKRRELALRFLSPDPPPPTVQDRLAPQKQEASGAGGPSRRPRGADTKFHPYERRRAETSSNPLLRLRDRSYRIMGDKQMVCLSKFLRYPTDSCAGFSAVGEFTQSNLTARRLADRLMRTKPLKSDSEKVVMLVGLLDLLQGDPKSIPQKVRETLAALDDISFCIGSKLLLCTLPPCPRFEPHHPIHQAITDVNAGMKRMEDDGKILKCVDVHQHILKKREWRRCFVETKPNGDPDLLSLNDRGLNEIIKCVENALPR